MSVYEIQGGRTLRGRLRIQGAKNSVLPILAAALLAPGQSVIRNCPRLSDVDAALRILEVLGCQVRRQDHVVTVDAAGLCRSAIPEELMGEMRSSVIFLGALLARTGEAELSYPGGCELGPRPIDLHLSALRALGAVISEENGLLTCRSVHKKGRDLFLPIPSVGATENIILAACGCTGTTTLVGAAREPEIGDLQNFLNAMGARVSGAGTTVISVEGGRPLHGADYTVMGDRIAAATCLCAVGAAGGEVELTGADPAHLGAVLSALEEAGSVIGTGPGLITLKQNGPLRGISPVRTAPYPGFPTDGQAVLMAALCTGCGTTMIQENMFDSRYRHVDELRRMGAAISTGGRTAVVTGVEGALHGAPVRCTDLRGGAALVVAGLAARGVTTVRELHHIRRGYEDLAGSLAALGAGIRELPSRQNRRYRWQQETTDDADAEAASAFL